MFRSDMSVSGCVRESPVARSTATLAPNVGLYAAREADRQTELELVRMMEGLVAVYREERSGDQTGAGGAPEAGGEGGDAGGASAGLVGTRSSLPHHASSSRLVAAPSSRYAATRPSIIRTSSSSVCRSVSLAALSPTLWTLPLGSPSHSQRRTCRF